MNESINQRIKDKLVQREVIMLATSLVEDLSEKLMFNSCSIYEIADNLFTGTTDDPDTDETKEPLEWYFVTEWFYEKLKKQDEVVCDTNYGYLWGRCTSGQAIAIDHVIDVIAKDMEILHGQKYEWE